MPNEDRWFDFLIYPCQIDVLPGMQTIVHSVMTRECGTACHLVINSHAPFFSLSHTHATEGFLCFNESINDQPPWSHPWSESRVIHYYVQGYLFVRKGLCNQDTVAKASSYRNDTDLYLLLRFFSSFSCYSSIPPPHSLAPSQQLNCLFCCTWKTKQVIHPSPLFPHLPPTLLL